MKRQIVDLQKEVNIREDQISHVQIISDELKHQIEDYRHTCDHYKNLNEVSDLCTLYSMSHLRINNLGLS